MRKKIQDGDDDMQIFNFRRQQNDTNFFFFHDFDQIRVLMTKFRSIRFTYLRLYYGVDTTSNDR